MKSLKDHNNHFLLVTKLNQKNQQLVLDQNSKLSFSSFSIGSSNSPIIAKIGGDIKIDQNNFMKSRLNLKGEVKFSDDFLDQIVNIPTSRFSKYCRGILLIKNML